MKPYKLDLSQFGNKVRDEITFEISNVSDAAVHPTMIYYPKGMFSVVLPSSIDPGETKKGKLKLDESVLEFNTLEKSFTIQLDDEKSSRFTVPVKRTVRKPATAHESGE